MRVCDIRKQGHVRVCVCYQTLDTSRHHLVFPYPECSLPLYDKNESLCLSHTMGTNESITRPTHKVAPMLRKVSSFHTHTMAPPQFHFADVFPRSNISVCTFCFDLRVQFVHDVLVSLLVVSCSCIQIICMYVLMYVSQESARCVCWVRASTNLWVLILVSPVYGGQCQVWKVETQNGLWEFTKIRVFVEVWWQ